MKLVTCSTISLRSSPYLRCGRKVASAEYNGNQQYYKLVQWK